MARYSCVVGEYSRRDAAQRAGVNDDDLSTMVELGILVPDEDDRFSAGDIRRISLVHSFATAGIPLDGLAADLRQGGLSLAWLDNPTYDRFASYSPETFQAMSDRLGVPVELLMVIREAIGGALPAPDDRVREDELTIVPLVAAQFSSGFERTTIERALRANGDSLRRVAEVEADWFRNEVIEPRTAGRTGAEIAAIAVEFSEQFTPLNEQAVLGIYHAHQAHALTSNTIMGFERALAGAGLDSRMPRPPAMCFLDITGYTRLTQEGGDVAAADLAETLARLVQRTSRQYGGRPVKWLGDGVMLYFREPGPAVVAALEMGDGVVAAGLPRAHVGLHAGPVVFQAGDYFGQTVNVAARIAEYARSGEVVVSHEVVDAAGDAPVSFTGLGPVELKGVGGVMQLYVAHRRA